MNSHVFFRLVMVKININISIFDPFCLWSFLQLQRRPQSAAQGFLQLKTKNVQCIATPMCWKRANGKEYEDEHDDDEHQDDVHDHDHDHDDEHEPAMILVRCSW